MNTLVDFRFIFTVICMGFKRFLLFFVGSSSFFVAICMGFKALPISFVHRRMGFKLHHVKTHVNTSKNT